MKCNCIEEVNKSLAERGIQLDTVLTFSLKSSDSDEQIYVPTRRLGATKPKKKPPTLFANFCPFCGEATGLKKLEAA